MNLGYNKQKVKLFNLDDIIFDSDPEIIIKDTNNDGIVKDNIQGNRNNVEIIFDEFNTVSNKLFDSMTLIDSIDITPDI